jgi:hypothetical protein
LLPRADPREDIGSGRRGREGRREAPDGREERPSAVAQQRNPSRERQLFLVMFCAFHYVVEEK